MAADLGATTYSAVSWTAGDVITEAKLDSMVANDQAYDSHAAQGLLLNNDKAFAARNAAASETYNLAKINSSNQIEYGAVGLSILRKGNWDGWVSVGDTWTYASATTITVPSGAASKYRKGDRIKLTQTTVKYFYIVGVADTLLTITGGSSYTLTNAAISENYYSHEDTPVGFPVSFNLTAPTFSASGTAFTNQPSATSYVLSIQGDIATVIFEPQTASSGTGTGIWTLTFTSGQMPSTSLSCGGLAGGTGSVPNGLVMIQASVPNVLKVAKFDGATSIVANSAFFYGSISFRI